MDDKRQREEEIAIDSRRVRRERQWLAAPNARRQPRVGEEYQITSLPSVGREVQTLQATECKQEIKEKEVSMDDSTGDASNTDKDKGE